jgi:DNA (cytosine-5)-methyltransferase 1
MAMGVGDDGDPQFTLQAAHCHAIASIQYDTDIVAFSSNMIKAAAGGNTVQMIHSQMQVRRLTPMECERLQGFSDGYTKIPWRGKPATDCPDGPRYKALGNSMAVPVMHWIGNRINMYTTIGTHEQYVQEEDTTIADFFS